MPSDDTIRAEFRTQGLHTKRNNLVVAALSASFFASISLWFFPHSAGGILLGFVGGSVYANAFEYFLHRFLMHSGRGFSYNQHMMHHTTLNLPEAPRYVNFSRNPWGVVALFCANSVPLLFLQWMFRNTWTAGTFLAFGAYYIAFEEIHWRAHMGGWLPAWLRPAARHHLLHHADDAGRFNVFLPVFDWLLGSGRKSGAGGRAHDKPVAQA